MNEHKQTDEGHLLRPQKPNPPPLLRRHRSMGHQTHADPYRFAVWRLPGACAGTRRRNLWRGYHRNRGRYNDVLIQEFPYKENTPESVGRWRPLIEELVKLTLAKYRTLDGLARAYPQWVPEETVLPFPRQALESAEHIIFHDNGICEMIPRAGSSKANIVPPTAADCGEEC